jgi:hypothetical protein
VRRDFDILFGFLLIFRVNVVLSLSRTLRSVLSKPELAAKQMAVFCSARTGPVIIIKLPFTVIV